MYTVIGVKITKYQIHFEKTRRFDSAAICDVRVLPFRYLLSESDCLHPVMTQLAPLFITTAWISFCANAAYCWSIDWSERNLCHVYSWCSVCCFFLSQRQHWHYSSSAATIADRDLDNTSSLTFTFLIAYKLLWASCRLAARLACILQCIAMFRSLGQHMYDRAINYSTHSVHWLT